jgi:hypothetical protein
MIYDLIADANGPTIEVHHPVIVAWELVSLANLLSLPHLLARKIRGKEPLVDYRHHMYLD